MTDTGARLGYLIDKDSFIITDLLAGKNFTWNDGAIVTNSLDIDIILKEINNITEAIQMASVSTQHFVKRDENATPIVRIDHVRHFEWRITYNGYICELTAAKAKMPSKFDMKQVNTRLQATYATLLKLRGLPRNPKVDIVRRISDAHLLLWVHEGHTVVHTEESAQGLCMVNCLIDGVAYDCVVVSPSSTTKTCALLKLDGELIHEFPLDDSILAYYKPAEDVFEKTDV